MWQVGLQFSPPTPAPDHPPAAPGQRDRHVQSKARQALPHLLDGQEPTARDERLVDAEHEVLGIYPHIEAHYTAEIGEACLRADRRG